MGRKRTKGKCQFCDKALTNSGMQKHLPTCQTRQNYLDKLRSKGANNTDVLHIMVEGGYGSDYWLHLRVKGSMKLKTLDIFLEIFG